MAISASCCPSLNVIFPSCCRYEHTGSVSLTVFQNTSIRDPAGPALWTVTVVSPSFSEHTVSTDVKAIIGVSSFGWVLPDGFVAANAPLRKNELRTRRAATRASESLRLFRPFHKHWIFVAAAPCAAVSSAVISTPVCSDPSSSWSRGCKLLPSSWSSLLQAGWR